MVASGTSCAGNGESRNTSGNIIRILAAASDGNSGSKRKRSNGSAAIAFAAADLKMLRPRMTGN